MFKKIIFCLILLLSLSYISAEAFKDRNLIKIITKITPKKNLIIGDKFKLQIKIKYAPHILIEKIYLPDFEQKNDKNNINKNDLVLKSKKQEPATKKNLFSNKVMKIFQYELAVYQLGKYKFPPVKVQYKINGSTKTIQTDEISIKVQGVISKKDIQNNQIDIKNIKPDIKKSWLNFWFLLLLLPLIGVIIFLYFKKQKEIQKKALTADILALKKLRELKHKKLPTKEFYFYLSEILKEYLENRYQINILEKTTNEIFYILKNNNILDRSQLNSLKIFLEEADLVKFAKFIPTQKTTEIHYKYVQNFIERTKIKIVKE
ncbi:MAG: hypothetical protein GY830_02510 [Bacteroidetes bacterium]|nr:hypothetical protein [Bacteroidota bacterium]